MESQIRGSGVGTRGGETELRKGVEEDEEVVRRERIRDLNGPLVEWRRPAELAGWSRFGGWRGSRSGGSWGRGREGNGRSGVVCWMTDGRGTGNGGREGEIREEEMVKDGVAVVGAMGRWKSL